MSNSQNPLITTKIPLTLKGAEIQARKTNNWNSSEPKSLANRAKKNPHTTNLQQMSLKSCRLNCEKSL